MSTKMITTNLSRAKNVASSLRCCRSKKTFLMTSVQMIGSRISAGVQKIAESGARPSKRQPAGVETTGNSSSGSLSQPYDEDSQTHFPRE